MALHPRQLLAVSAVVLAGVALSVAATQASALDETVDKDDARQKIESLIDQGDWKAASKAIKSFRKKHAETDEEKADCDRLKALAEGSEALAKIETDYQKKQHPRKTSRSLGKFIAKYDG